MSNCRLFQETSSRPDNYHEAIADTFLCTVPGEKQELYKHLALYTLCLRYVCLGQCSRQLQASNRNTASMLIACTGKYVEPFGDARLYHSYVFHERYVRL